VILQKLERSVLIRLETSHISDIKRSREIWKLSKEEAAISPDENLIFLKSLLKSSITPLGVHFWCQLHILKTL